MVAESVQERAQRTEPIEVGIYFDEETGLQKHGVRYYDTARARFTQLDPLFGEINDPITLNRYQYAGCDPANNVDPSGGSHGGVHYWDATAETAGFAAACFGGALGAAYLSLPQLLVPLIGQASFVVSSIIGCLIGGGFAATVGVSPFEGL